MSDERQPAPKFELLQSDDYSQFLVRERREVVFLLRQLATRRANITAYFGNSDRFLLTSVVGVSDNDHDLFLDIGADEALNAEALLAGSLLCLTQLDKVKIQFSVERPLRVTHERLPALRVPLPAALLRLQRREYYRLTTPPSHALTCHIPLASQVVEARVLDISGGGVAVVAPPGDLAFTPETVFRACRLELPDFGPITTNLRVRSLFRLTNRNGVEVLRAGCQFLDLTTPMANAIQRYILKVERERKARENGI